MDNSPNSSDFFLIFGAWNAKTVAFDQWSNATVFVGAGGGRPASVVAPIRRDKSR